MSDFGANIFDDGPTGRPPAPPADEPPAAAPEAPREAAPARPRPPHDEAPRRERAPEREPHRTRQDGDRGPRRHEREPRDRRDRERDDRGRREREHRDDRRAAGAPRPPTPHTASASTKPASAPTAAVALFVDVDSLRANANEANVELAWNRLCRGLARSRAVACARAYAEGSRKAPAGFEARPADDGLQAGVELASGAFAAAGQGQTVVLAPGSPAMRSLAAALRARGHAVELYGVTADDRGDVPVARMGRDCLFVP